MYGFYRPPSNASVQPRAQMTGGTYGTLGRRASPGMNSASPFGYQRPSATYGQKRPYGWAPHGGIFSGFQPQAPQMMGYRPQGMRPPRMSPLMQYFNMPIKQPAPQLARYPQLFQGY